jgi:hypothetical protein
MHYLKIIEKIASTLSLGSSKYIDCPKCQRKNKCGLTHKPDGIIYNCFSASCNFKGKIHDKLSNNQIAQILKVKAITDEERYFRLPTYLIDGFASETGLKLALQYDLLKAYTDKQFKTSYDPKLNRQVFYYRNHNNAVVGAVGRALSPKIKPKAHIYPDSEKTPWVIGKDKTAVIVEDIFSAVKIYNIGLTGIALSGTKLSAEYLEMFKKYDKIIICLDKDASIQSLEIKKALDFICNSVIIQLIQKDFKDMTRDEAKKVLGIL